MSGREARRRGLLVMVLLLVFVCGCGGRPVADVSGRVTIRGKPPELKLLLISFVTTEGQSCSAKVAEDGSYSITGVPSGEVKIGFIIPTLRESASKGAEQEDRKSQPVDPKQKMLERKAAAKGGKSAGKATPVPEKYHDPLTSGVTTNLTPGPNTFDFDIK